MNHPNLEKICVIGLGYIGLPSSALLASRGYQVHGVDVSPKVVEIINAGKIHIVEPDLDTFVQAAVQSGRLQAALAPAEADIFIIAVPTPFHEGHVPDVDYVVAAARSLATFVRPGNIVILESTSPVGTTELVRDTLIAAGAKVDEVLFAHCPERVLPGRIMIELVQNDRIVGGLTPEATRRTAEFYRNFVSGQVLETDARTAEMAKLTENSYRDTNIAFANELSILCDKNGIDVWELIALANRHPRVKILQPGCGVGGHCIAVDPWFIVHQGGADAKLIRSAREVNDRKAEWVVEKVKSTAAEWKQAHGRDPIVACMGLAFKPDIDDLRESPALQIAKALNAAGVQMVCVEPNIDADHPKLANLPLVTLAELKADIAVFLVAHTPFKGWKGLLGTVELDFCGVRRKEQQK